MKRRDKIVKNVSGYKKIICLFFFSVLAISCFGQNYGTNGPFRLEFNLFGLEIGGGNETHILIEYISLGLSYEIFDNLNIQLLSKCREGFLSGFPKSGSIWVVYPSSFAESSFPVYLSLIFEINKDSYFYITGGGNNWSVEHEMPYISSAIGYKLDLGNFGNFNILYVGCELQWIRVWQSQIKNDIISANFTLGFGGYRSNVVQ